MDKGPLASLLRRIKGKGSCRDSDKIDLDNDERLIKKLLAGHAIYPPSSPRA